MHSSQQHQIELVAYQIWENEGRPIGRQDVHWRQAEQRVAGTASTTDTPKESLEIDDQDLNEQGDETLSGNERGGD
jgi:hypothetical protein